MRNISDDLFEIGVEFLGERSRPGKIKEISDREEEVIGGAFVNRAGP